MKKAYRPEKKSQTPDIARLGAVLAMVTGVVVLAVAGFLLFGSNAPANGSGANFTPQAKGAPRLKADRQKVDLGNVKLGQTVQVSFDIANTGDQPLRFVKDPFVEVVEGC